MARLQKSKILVICIAISLSLSCFPGCSMQPPTAKRVEQLYLKYESDFRAVQDYLTGISADSVSIWSNTENILVDLTHQRVDDPLVADSLMRLWQAGCSRISMDRGYNSIIFVLWHTGMVGDAEAGLLYAIDTEGGKLPTAQYLTELQPLSQSPWYYYVADYNEWRNRRGNG